MKSNEKIKIKQHIQARILANAVQLLKPGSVESGVQTAPRHKDSIL